LPPRTGGVNRGHPRRTTGHRPVVPRGSPGAAALCGKTRGRPALPPAGPKRGSARQGAATLPANGTPWPTGRAGDEGRGEPCLVCWWGLASAEIPITWPSRMRARLNAGPPARPHDAGGALQLAQAIQEQTTRHGCDTVRIDCEVTGVYAWPRVLGLSQPTDPPRPWTVSRLQPRTVHRSAATLAGKRAKTDHQDPWCIAEGLSHAAWLPRPFPVAERSLALQRLTRHRHHVVRN
jgi:hypothetical protein